MRINASQFIHYIFKNQLLLIFFLPIFKKFFFSRESIIEQNSNAQKRSIVLFFWQPECNLGASHLY